MTAFYRIIFFSTILIGITLSATAQNDVVLKTDGEELIGKVTSINKVDIDFIYQNETLQYQVPKTKISKITFASGRVQFFNNSTSLKDHHNKVAILPFALIKNQQEGSNAMSQKIQQETYSVYQNHNGILKFQDPMTTNRLLRQAGIGTNDRQNYAMGELCNILGVEYLVQGLVSIEETGSSTYSSSTTNVKTSNRKPVKTFVGKLFDNSGTNVSTGGATSSSKTYSTSITMNVFNDKGENLFSKDHNSFWQTSDAYKVTLKYLAKRTPLYTK
ncbi:MAG: hypothetical protein WBA16_06585 [Nonlabens sp.]